MKKYDYECAVFTSKGLFISKYSDKKEEWLLTRPKKLSILTHLRKRCEIEDDVIFKNILDAVDRYEFLKMFVSQYSWCKHIDEFHAQAQEPMRAENEEKLDFLEINHGAEVNKFEEKITNLSGLREIIKTVDFETYVEFTGKGKVPKGKEKEYGMKAGEQLNYSVSCTPMYELTDLPVKLNKEFDVFEPWEKKHNKNNLPKLLLKSTREFTLLEILDAIYWDISFYGGPLENKNFIEETNDIINKIKNGEIDGTN